MHLEGIILNEMSHVSQRTNIKYDFIYESKKISSKSKKQHSYITENRLIVIRGKGGMTNGKNGRQESTLWGWMVPRLTVVIMW